MVNTNVFATKACVYDGGVEVTKSKVRRERSGHIELAAQFLTFGISKVYQAVWDYYLTCHQEH